MLREQFLTYVKKGDEYLDLNDFIDHIPVPANESSAGKLYGKHFKALTNQELAGTINLWSYSSVDTVDDLSLIQLGEFCGTGGTTGTVIDTVESGFAKSSYVWGDNNLHLFTFFTVQGYSPPFDHYLSSWNEQKKGFVRYIGATSFPGATMSSSTMSTIGGAQYECTVKINRGQDGNWWIWACGNWLGYYPTQFSNSVVAAKRITFSVMGVSACLAQEQGEVGSHRGALATTWGPTDMGSGMYASAGYGQAAYIRQPEYRTTTAGPPPPIPFPNNPITSGAGYDSHCYTVSSMINGGGVSVNISCSAAPDITARTAVFNFSRVLTGTRSGNKVGVPHVPGQVSPVLWSAGLGAYGHGGLHGHFALESAGCGTTERSGRLQSVA